MKPLMEEIFEQALIRLKNGSSKEEVLSEWAEHKSQLEPLLDTACYLLDLPKKEAPEPAMQRKFMLAPAKKIWFAWLHVSKFASVSISAVLILTAVAGTGYAASQSMPGQALFSVKKVTERAHLKLTTNPADKVSLQMEIAKKRLSEAQQVFQNPERSSKQEIAALTELSAQTKNTIEALDTVTKSSPTPQSSHPIVASLEDLANKQQALIKEIGPDAVASAAATSAIKDTVENATKVAAIKQYLEAASNEQTLTKLENGATAASGTASQLPVDSTLGTVKSASTTDSTASSTPKAGASSTPQSVKKPAQDNVGQDIPAADPNTAVGTFIPEDPQPQSAF